MSQPGRGPATSLPSLRLLRMTAFGTSRCRPPRCHVAAVSSDRGKNHDPAGTEAASHWSVTPCSPPSRPGRCAVGAGAPSLDRRCARCPGDGWPGQENGASTEQKNRGQAKKSLQSGRRLKNEGRDKQAEQAAGKPTGGPFVAVQHAVVVGEVRDLVQPHHPQCGCDGAPTGHEDRTHHQHHHMVPGRRGERVPEWLHPFSQPAWYIASRCVPHSFIPESIFRGDSPISRLLRIAHVITLDSITQDSTRFSSRHYQRHSWLISLDGILCGSENGQTQAEGSLMRTIITALLWAAIIIALWLAVASGAFLWLAGLWDSPRIPWWSRPWQFATYAMHGDGSFSELTYLVVAAIIASVPGP